ncbi:SurA N-terminal domain-containing protein [Saliterribacillus persicus]|uniref:peptidylprolyl isomerase n=1 Tax=Saliterribacillus persicus TaxID=930114 RepID=A0A368Y6H1_9BACI|nr:SurA N-terminal domain-containing protein [Saliterribacillus persicus]RCW74958.1 peptidyl-prolyl cis-trans isomerase SurA [Saliterribacillus persicus]
MSKKWILGLLLAISVLVLGACSDDAEESQEENNNEDEAAQEETTEEEAGEEESGEEAAPEGEAGTQQPEMPEPDLEGIPDVVASVNDEEITKEEFEQTYSMQFQQAMARAQMSGQEVDQDQLKTQIAESMVGQELVIQEANNSGIEATDEQIDQTLTELAQQNGLETKDEFITALGDQGMDEEEVMSQVETQVKVDELVSNEAGDTEITEEELRETYDELVAGQEQGGEDVEIPEFEEVKPNIEDQLKQQKEAEAFQSLVDKLREDADVTINL